MVSPPDHPAGCLRGKVCKVCQPTGPASHCCDACDAVRTKSGLSAFKDGCTWRWSSPKDQTSADASNGCPINTSGAVKGICCGGMGRWACAEVLAERSAGAMAALASCRLRVLGACSASSKFERQQDGRVGWCPNAKKAVLDRRPP